MKRDPYELTYTEIGPDKLIEFVNPFNEKLPIKYQEILDNSVKKIKENGFKVYIWSYDAGFLAAGAGYEIRDKDGKVIEHKRTIVS